MSLARLFRSSAAIRGSATATKLVNSPVSLYSHQQRSIVQNFIAPISVLQSRTMSDGAHPHLNRNELFDMHGFTAVVTGGGTGIGLMITLALVENGCKVFITSRDKSKLEDVVKRYGGDGTERGEIVPVEVDITSKDSLAQAIQTIETQTPKGIQVLVNNAGIAGEGSREGYESVDMKDPDAISAQLWKSETSEWDAILRTNVTSQYFTATAFLPLLAKGKDLFKGYASQIINVTSISGVMKKASGGQYAYAASKAAMFQFTKVLATELQETGIRVNQIAPGVFPSQMTAGSKRDDQKSSLAGTGKGESNPAGRPGDEKDMAGTILFLASRAGVYFNGQELHPDGGATISGPSSL